MTKAETIMNQAAINRRIVTTAKPIALQGASANEKAFTKRAFFVISALLLAAWFATG